MADYDAVEGDWLVAFHQSAGKGRQGREWVSASGNFYGSTLVELASDDPSAQSLSLAAGLALIEAVDAAVPGQPLMLKWPNDLMLGGMKLAGILLERSGNRVAAGFGVNLTTQPQLSDRRAAALGGRINPQAFAPLLAGSFTRLVNLWRTSSPESLTQAWLARAHLPGTRLAVHISADDAVTGRFAGLEADGALRLMLDDGSIEVIRAGDVDLG